MKAAEEEVTLDLKWRSWYSSQCLTWWGLLRREQIWLSVARNLLHISQLDLDSFVLDTHKSIKFSKRNFYLRHFFTKRISVYFSSWITLERFMLSSVYKHRFLKHFSLQSTRARRKFKESRKFLPVYSRFKIYRKLLYLF